MLQPDLSFHQPLVSDPGAGPGRRARPARPHAMSARRDRPRRVSRFRRLARRYERKPPISWASPGWPARWSATAEPSSWIFWPITTPN